MTHLAKYNGLVNRNISNYMQIFYTSIKEDTLMREEVYTLASEIYARESLPRTWQNKIKAIQKYEIFISKFRLEI